MYIEISLKYEKNILLSSSRAFSLSTPTFSLSTQWTTVRLHGKKLQNATNNLPNTFAKECLQNVHFYMDETYKHKGKNGKMRSMS